MKKILVFTLLAVFAFSGSVLAQAKFASVDIQRVVAEAEAGVKAKEEMMALEAGYAKQLEPLQNELTKLEKEYMEQEKALTEAAKKTRIEAFQKKGMEYENQARLYNTKLREKEEELMEKILVSIDTVIKKIGDSGKYDAVFYKQALFYAPKITDITDEVIKQYNADFKKGK